MNNARCTHTRKTAHGLDGQHQHMGGSSSGKVNQNDREQRQMEKVRPWCGQPLDRGRLKNRTELHNLPYGMVAVHYVICYVSVSCCTLCYVICYVSVSCCTLCYVTCNVSVSCCTLCCACPDVLQTGCELWLVKLTIKSDRFPTGELCVNSEMEQKSLPSVSLMLQLCNMLLCIAAVGQWGRVGPSGL